jgi:hypothetical protein
MTNQKQRSAGGAGAGFILQMPRKSNLRREYRLRQRERIEASPLMAEKFRRLKALRVTLEFFDPGGTSKQGGMKCKMYVEQARTVLWFACPSVACTWGDFDLSEALAKAVGRGGRRWRRANCGARGRAGGATGSWWRAGRCCGTS